ncbi:Major Facilitator Superfamily protein [Micromonospora haikouensis]|uniref:Major Facilitator Superfamily protein n=1 Tax=Micromonospora haikouensis TaxID=686309 RepID=A0A1C4XDV6_9ACTN|nr:MFS transporter [Micromonospora haikouensis]SCF06703.1 Major Facilitator Superfamily protein [Micromonospora haikouensis]
MTLAILRRALPEPGPGRHMVVATLLVSIGFSLYSAASVLYFHQQVGLPAGQIGLALTIAAIIGLPLRVPLGRMADRYGPREVTMVMEVLLGLSLIGLCLVTSFAAFAVMVSIIAIAETGTNVVFGALLAGVLGKQDRVKISAHMRSVFNGGFAVGAGLGGLILAVDSRAVYLGALGGYGVVRLAIAVARFWLPHVPPAPKQAPDVPKRSAVRDVPYALLGQISNFYVLSDKILLIGIPLWVVGHTKAPAALVAVLLGISTGIVTLFQVPASRGADTVPGAGRLQHWSLLSLAACCVLIGASAWGGNAWVAGGVMLAAVVLLTMGEMWGSAAEWELRYELADQKAQGQWGAMFSLGNAMPDVLGPLMVTVLVERFLFGGWLALAALFVLVSLFSKPVVHWTVRTRSRYTTSPDAPTADTTPQAAAT